MEEIDELKGVIAVKEQVIIKQKAIQQVSTYIHHL